MYQLIYISKSVLYFSKQDLDKLAAKSSVSNQNLGITGMLMYIDGEFMQLLEGNKSDVEQLMHQIHQDERHYSLNIIKEEYLEQREFSNWAMATQLMTKSHLKLFLPEEHIDEPVGLPSLVNKTNHRDLINSLFIRVRDNLLLPRSYIQ